MFQIQAATMFLKEIDNKRNKISFLSVIIINKHPVRSNNRYSSQDRRCEHERVKAHKIVKATQTSLNIGILSQIHFSAETFTSNC